ncbi:hypothetical protein ACFY0A_42860 [Streptomyces sp. NPDC001698]|uniref:hypothetical protein n=1 Tax=Streptomyces sp. NPDC001698 TaxID=3364601 RepID=UPI0036976EDD
MQHVLALAAAVWHNFQTGQAVTFSPTAYGYYTFSDKGHGLDLPVQDPFTSRLPPLVSFYFG